MRRDELEHIVRAVGEVLGEDQVYVFGSQSILGAFPDGLPRAAIASTELDSTWTRRTPPFEPVSVGEWARNATLDRRHFGVVRPCHTAAFTLVP